jgi:hypothetical protein
MVVGEAVELGAARPLLLEGDDLAQALDAVDRERAELTRRLARRRAQAVDPLALDEGAESGRQQEGSKASAIQGLTSASRTNAAAGTSTATKAGATVWAKKYSTSSTSWVASAIRSPVRRRTR